MSNDPVDLRRYKQARAEREQRDARAKAQHRRPRGKAAGGHEPILGGNPRAKLFLVALAVIMLILWLGPMLLL